MHVLTSHTSNQQGDPAFMQATNSTRTTNQPLTPDAAAEYLGLDVKTVTRWARQGYLPGHPLGEGKRKFWRFFESELQEWLAAKSNRSDAA
jgi:excisionase family DNA binding protein